MLFWLVSLAHVSRPPPAISSILEAGEHIGYVVYNSLNTHGCLLSGAGALFGFIFLSLWVMYSMLILMSESGVVKALCPMVGGGPCSWVNTRMKYVFS